MAFSPERIDPGNEEYGTTDIAKVFGGVTDTCGDRIEALCGPVFDELVRIDSAMEAELVKLLENTFRSVNIALINEMATIAHELGVDIWTIIDAAATKPFGFMPFYPGPELGGTAFRWTRSISPGRSTSTASPPGSSTSRIASTARCPNTSSTGWSRCSTTTESQSLTATCSSSVSPTNPVSPTLVSCPRWIS